MRSYEAARSLFSFLGFCSWAVIILGAVLAFSGGTIVGTGMGRGASGLSALMGAAPGFILAMLGFYGLALVQMGRAGVDSAEYAQQSLDVSRQQLEVSKQVLQQSKETASSYTAQAGKKHLGGAAVAEETSVNDPASYNGRADEQASADATLEPSKIGAQTPPTTLAEPGAEVKASELLGDTCIIAGRELVLIDGKYKCGGLYFTSLEQAESHYMQLDANNTSTKTRA